MPPRILIQKESGSSLVLMDLTEATLNEKAAVAALLGLRTRNSRYPLVALGLLLSDGPIFLTKPGERVFPPLQPPVSPETIEALAAAWLAEISAKT